MCGACLVSGYVVEGEHGPVLGQVLAQDGAPHLPAPHHLQHNQHDAE